MSQMTESVCELLPSKPCDLYAKRPEPVGSGPHCDEARLRSRSRTSLKRYILDPVLPMLTLLSMSALTVVMLVVIVTTVADMDLQLPGGYVNIDPWAGASLGSAGGFYQDPGAYADLVTPMPTEDREFWPDSPITDPYGESL